MKRISSFQESIELLKEIKLILRKGFEKPIKEWFPISIIVDIPLSTTDWTIINDNFKDFPFAYLFDSLEIRSETNSLAKIKIRLNGMDIPLQAYLIDSTNNWNPTIHQSYYPLNTESKIYPFKYQPKKPFRVEILGINTHTAKQKVYITFNGWKLSENKLLE